MASSAAIRAGRAFVELFADDGALVRGLQTAERRVQAWGKNVAKAGLGLTAIGGTALAPITKAFTNVLTRAADFKTLSDRFGVTTEKLSAMTYAFERGGSDMDEFAATMEHVQGVMFENANHQGTTFDQLFLNARNMAKLPLDKQFDMLLSRVNRLSNPMDRARVGTELFGNAWSKLSNTTLRSAEAFDDTQMEAFRRGLVTTTAEAESAQQFMLSFKESLLAVQYAFMEIGKALFPQLGTLGSFADMIRKAADEARAWITENRGLIVGVTELAAIVVAGGIALTALGSILSGVGTAFGVVAVAAKLLIGAFGLLFSPAGLVLAGVAAVGYLSGAFDGLGKVFGETWGGIVDAIASGDIRLALKIVSAGAEAVWATFVANLTEVWVKFKNLVVDTWHYIGDVAKTSIAALKAGVTWITDGQDAAALQFDRETDAIVAHAHARDEENRKFRQQQVENARAREAEARAELAALTNKAKAQAAAKGAGASGETSTSIGPDGKANHAGAGRLPDPQQLYLAAKGSFASIGGGNIRQSLGYGDNIGQRVLEVNKKHLTVSQAILEVAKGQKAIAWK